jgi:hypothetical protein
MVFSQGLHIVHVEAHLVAYAMRKEERVGSGLHGLVHISAHEA